ncbi:MAG: diacylglycerol/lipid kinase family protein [Gaiellaceae bacterium]
MARALLIVNPYASAVTDERVDAVMRALGPVDLATTESPGHATELARDASGRVERLYVFSGDGGFNEVLNGADGETPLGFVPGGGTNVLPRALGLPRNPVQAAERLTSARPRRISLGRANGRRFGFSAGLGLDAELVRRVDALGRTGEGKRAGDLAFAWTAVRTLVEHRARLQPEIALAGLGRVAFALVANADPYTYAGPFPLRVAPLARFELGLDVVGPRRLTPGLLPRFLFYLARGGGQEDDPRVLYRHDVDRIDAACDRPTPLQVDGEDLGDVTEAAFEAERGAVLVLA